MQSIENSRERTEDEEVLERSNLKLTDEDWEFLRKAQDCQVDTSEYFEKMINFWKRIETKNVGHLTPRLKLMILEIRLNETREREQEVHIH